MERFRDLETANHHPYVVASFYLSTVTIVSYMGCSQFYII